jgi:hypothetical protein
VLSNSSQCRQHSPDHANCTTYSLPEGSYRCCSVPFCHTGLSAAGFGGRGELGGTQSGEVVRGHRQPGVGGRVVGFEVCGNLDKQAGV